MKSEVGVKKACLDPPFQVVLTRNPMTYSKGTIDPAHPDLGGFLVKNKNLLADENSRTKNSQTDKHSKMFKQLEKDHKQQALLNIQQNLQFATTQRLEEKIQKFQKQLSDLKLANKNMKTLLTRVNVLKDKTFEKLRQSLTKAEALKGKTVMKTDNLKTTLISAEQVARWDKERAHNRCYMLSLLSSAQQRAHLKKHQDNKSLLTFEKLL
ncbi:Laminin Subunit Alpha-3 [Manis pentadactyla]|nr:Laminin Subunit Alpha-3 [Manis pentadactyla]